MTGEMPETLRQILALLQEVGVTGFLVFLRVGAAAALLPAFGERSVPVRVRMAGALAFTIIIAPAVTPQLVTPSLAAGGLARAFATEVVAGLVIGAGLRLFVQLLQIAGTMAAQATSLAQFFGGVGVDPQPAFSQLLVMGGLALAVLAGLHVRIVETFILSYDMLPPGAFPAADDLAQWGVARVAAIFAAAFSLAAPFAIAALIYNVALGVINRAMPQLMVAFVGAPALTAGGLVLMLLVTPAALTIWLTMLNGFLADPVGGGGAP